MLIPVMMLRSAGLPAADHWSPAIGWGLPGIARVGMAASDAWALMGAGAGGIIIGLAVALVIGRRRLGKARASEQRARASERLAEVGAMTSGLAHELKNPLSTIRLNAQLLAESIEDLAIDPDERGRLVRRIGALHRETERLSDTLEDFLNYAGEMRLSPERVNLADLVGELGDFLHPQLDRDAVRMRLDLAGDGPVCSADPLRLKQALLNLMLNASQAMASRDAGAAPRELIVKTGVGERKGIGPCAQVHVIDTGPGMDGPTLAKIYEPYFTTKRGGVGLGLPTTRRIVEAHGGELAVHSEPGRGTEFIIALPMAAPESA